MALAAFMSCGAVEPLDATAVLNDVEGLARDEVAQDLDEVGGWHWVEPEIGDHVFVHVDRVYSVKVSECGKSMHGDSRGLTRPKISDRASKKMKFTCSQN